MPLRTPDEYRQSLRDGRAVYVSGQRVQDVTADPILQIAVGHSANVYELALRPEFQELFTLVSPETGQRVSRYYQYPCTAKELLLRGNLIEENSRQGNSTFNPIKVIGSDALFALTVVCHDMDRVLKTDYEARLKKYASYCREQDLATAVAQTDVKGDRSLRPHEQPDPDVYLHIVERNKEGIVVRGAKAHTTSSAVVNEIVVLPTRALSEADKDYALAFAVPVASPGLKLICRTTGSTEQSTFDYPVSRRNILTESLTIFDDVFVPWERVFMAGEWQFAGQLAITFANYHRYSAVSYKPPLIDLFIGAAQLIAEHNGVDNAAHIRDKISHLVNYAEAVRACRKMAALEPRATGAGLVQPNPIYCNVGKYHFASNFHQAVAYLQDIAGGLSITAPGERDLLNPETGQYLRKYLAARRGTDSVLRLRLFHLIRDLTASEFGGYNMVLSINAEGSPAAQLITNYREYDIERCKRLVKKAMGVE